MSTIYTTKDYDMFALLSENRNVGKLDTLRESMKRKNLLPVFPLVVNNALQVIDGQHRLAVAKELGLVVSYVVDDSVELQDIPIAASCVAKWTLLDFCRHHAARGNKNYSEMLRVLEEYPFATLALVLYITPGRLSCGPIEKNFQTGGFSAFGLDHVRKVLAQCARYRSITNNGVYRRRSFVCAMSKLMKWEWFDPDRLFEKVSNWPTLVVPCVDSASTIEMLERIYNYRSKNKISFFEAA